MGQVGSGKTTIMRALSNVLSSFKDCKSCDLSFHVIETQLITAEFTKLGFEGMEDFTLLKKHGALYTESICFDDLGGEPVPAYFYQNGNNVINDIMMRRYTSMKERNKANYFTHATTILDAKGLDKIYMNRAYSRMIEMFNPLMLQGGDRRK